MSHLRTGRTGIVAAYRDLFQEPGTARFVAAGFVSRLTTSMVGIGLVLALSTGGRYTLAGAVAATLVLASSLANPPVGRLVDRYGQDRVLVPVTAGFGVAMLLIIVALRTGAPSWLLFPLAAAAGASMPVAAPLVRARWTKIYAGSDRLRTAYAWESMTVELVYITGPILVTALATGVGRLAGLAAVLACAVAGSLALAVQRATQPDPVPAGAGSGRTGVIRLPALQVLVLAEVAIGGVFGSMEIVTVGYATAHHARALSGLLLGMWGVGSLAAGLVFGALRSRLPLGRRLLVTVAAFAAALLPLPLVRGIPSLAGLLLLAGLAMAPAVITGMEVVQRVAPPDQLTEALSWALAGVGIGMTAGSLAGGWAVDHLDNVYAVPAASALLAAAVVIAGFRLLRDT